MNVKSLLNNQSIRICDHRRCGIHDWNDPTADIHLHKEPNSGLYFHGIIRISLRGTPSIEIEKNVKNQFRDPQKYKELRNRLLQEIKEAFECEKGDNSRDNFIREIVSVLHNDWNDKLSSEERAKDISLRIARAFGLENEAIKIIRETQNGKLSQYVSIYNSGRKDYYVAIHPNSINIGEASGKFKNKYN